MTSIAAGCYLPEIMVIKLKPIIEALADPNDPSGFQNPIQLGVFFHEWIHYLHNVSTLLSISTLNCTIGLWHIFRSTYHNSIPSGEDNIPEEDRLKLSEFISFLNETRSAKLSTQSDLVNRTPANSIIIKQVVLVEKVNFNGESIHAISCMLDIYADA